MDLSTVLANVDSHKYVTVREFANDVDLIWKNALEYNPDSDPSGRKTSGFLFFDSPSPYLLVLLVHLSSPSLLSLLSLSSLSLSPDRQIRHRACALKDTLHAIIRDELDEDFDMICEQIRNSRNKRGDCLANYVAYSTS